MLRQATILIIIAVAIALVGNLVSPNRIDFIGKYRDLSNGDGPIVPPTAEPGDPPFIDINVAQFEHASGDAIFVDARDEEEFLCGTIPGSIHMPFEYLPDDLQEYFNLKLAGYDGKSAIIVFCSGEECDLSLHLARNLQDFGYSNIAVFFGGAREWEKFDLGLERRSECGE